MLNSDRGTPPRQATSTLIAVISAIALILGLAPLTAAAADDVEVYVSFEGYNLGQGYFVEPVKVAVDDGQTVAEASLEALENAGITPAHGGAADQDDFYLQSIGVSDDFTPEVPSYLTDQEDFSLGDSNHDGALGEFDFNSMSGWMYTVDNELANVGAGAFKAADGQVVRWQFTLHGYGCDLGLVDGCWGADGPYFTQVDKTELIRTIVDAPDTTATEAERAAAKAVAINPLATEAQVADSTTALTTLPASNFGLTAPSDATVTLLRQNKNYSQSVIDESQTIDNGDGTTTHRFQVPTTNGTVTYRVSQPGKVTKAHWITALTDLNVTLSNDDPTSTGSSGISYADHDDAGILQNVGTYQHLTLDEGETFELGSFRAPWQIVNNTVSNMMIEPDYHYEILSGSDVVSIEPNATFPGWATLTATGKGSALVKVTYDAIDVGSARYGASADTGDGVFVVTVDAEQAGAINVVRGYTDDVWDSEINTYYLAEDEETAQAQITVAGNPDSVTAINPAVKEIQTLTEKDGAYDVTLHAGANIVRADEGDKVSYMVIRATNATPEITNETHPGEKPAPGDTVTIHLDGALLPVPKMAGIYNPTFTGAVAAYTPVTNVDGEAVEGTEIKGENKGQFTFSSANSLKVTIPEDAQDGYALTGGYISEAHFGSPVGAHRGITRDGVNPNLNAPTLGSNYSVLPDITLIGQKDVSFTAAIQGEPHVGTELTATVTDPNPADASFTYQWLRDGEEIESATSATYAPTAADLDATLSVRVEGSRKGYTASVVTTDSTAKVVGKALSSSKPTIGGTRAVGNKLTVKAGTWTKGAKLSYQWYRDGKKLSGYTDKSFTLTKHSLGKKLSVKVTGELKGYETLTVASSNTAAIKAGTLKTVKPTIGGTRQVGKKLTVKTGTWTKGTKLSYQWYRDGKKLTGYTKSTFTLTKYSLGKKLSVHVTGKLDGYTTVSVASSRTATVKAGTLTKATPKISGTTKVGKTLTAKAGTWTKGTKISYQWYRGGKKIAKATKSTYKLVKADKGHTIKVKTTGKLTGYTTAVKTSKATAKIK